VTSHDVVARVRRELPRGTRVGHAGTLDPFATGLLLVLVGRLTRAQRFLMALPKAYRAVARLGWSSDTGDRDRPRASERHDNLEDSYKSVSEIVAHGCAQDPTPRPSFPSI
jgi:tRNA pseudouridine(55) synthase